MESLMEGVKEANLFIQMGAVFLVSLVPFLEGYAAAPLGIFIGFPTVPTIIAASLGNWLSIMAIILLYKKLSRRLNAKLTGNRSGKRMEAARKLFNKYGVPGVAFIGPLLFGHHIGASVALVLGASRQYVVLWMTIGVLVWTIAAGVLAALGVDLTSRLR